MAVAPELWKRGNAKLTHKMLIPLQLPHKLYILPFLKSMTVKIAPLLAHYLYTNKRLDLPGIGTFLLDHPVTVEQETKQTKNTLLEGVSFENNNSIKEAPEDLIQYISTHSGRIKPLAMADLDSFLWLAVQFINIGKPYLIDGIGSLTKVNAGGYSFTPGFVLTEKLSDYVAKEAASTAAREADDNYKTIFYADKPRAQWKKPLVILLVLIGIGLAIWGGYTVYKKTSAKNDDPVKQTLPEEKTNPQTDTSSIHNDTTTIVPAKMPDGTVKFILQVSDQQKAMQRFTKLKNYQWNVQLETKDSVLYKIYML